MSLQEIEAAIERLSPDEYAALLARLHTREPEDEWDAQMAADADAGHLDGVLDDVRAEIAAGRARPL